MQMDVTISCFGKNVKHRTNSNCLKLMSKIFREESYLDQLLSLIEVCKEICLNEAAIDKIEIQI
ncbi:MAG: hypothetical protein PUP91_00190 [Rhizonema sp. PD37]|nr:hypothetical protein [Rhizonema sp. PD37]